MIKATAVGRIGTAPELQYTPSAKAVCKFRIGCDTGKERGGSTRTSWLTIIAWEDLAEHVAATFAKGDLIQVSGLLCVKEFDKRDGSRGYSVDITADSVSRPAKQERTKSAGTPTPRGDTAAPTPAGQPVARFGKGDDALPF